MKKSRKHICIILTMAISFLLAPVQGKAQVPSQLQQDPAGQGNITLREKLYVHTDRNFYLTGELLWFKVYETDAVNNKPLGLSKVAYIDVTDGHNNSILQAKIELKNGLGSGSVYLPVTVNTGNYKLRAYTNWMKNFGPECFFEKIISIVNPLKAPGTATATAPGFDIQFFPEGGSMVKNIAGKVGFKVTAPDGKGVDFKGAVIDGNNDTITRFTPFKFGMGSFVFTPGANNNYRAVIMVPHVKPIIQQLPDASDEGYALQVTSSGHNYIATVKSNLTGEASQVYMLVHTRQSLKIAQSKQLENGMSAFTIDKDSLGDGISTVTIFNGSKQPVCERLVFKYPAKKLMISTTTDQQLYSTRKKTVLSLSVKDETGQPVTGDFSVSVFKLDSLQNTGESDIVSYLWLSSDLKGYIESADYYLRNDNPETEMALDNLLLTQGWRRFKPGGVTNSNNPANYKFPPEYNCHLVSASLKSGDVTVNKAGVIGYLGIPGKNIQLYTAKSDSSGRFLFNAKLFYGPNELVAQTDFTTADSAYNIEVLSPFSDQYSDSPVPQFTISKGLKDNLIAHNVSMQVQNLYNADNNNRFFEPAVDSSAFYGVPTKTYLLDNYTRFPTMEEVLREYVNGVRVTKEQGKFHIRVVNSDLYAEGLKERPLALLDGIPIFDINRVFSIDPLKVRKLDVVNDRYFYGPTVSEGILSFTSYKGNIEGFDIDPKAVVVNYEGLNLRREFYSPVYESEQQINSPVPDFRDLLYWSPDVKTDEQGKYSMKFYTSDEQGKYIGIIQGITADGRAGGQSFTFEVKK